MDINFNYQPTEGQLQAFHLLHDKETRVIVLLFSRQCGKSVFAESACIEYLCKPYTTNIYITPNFSLAKKVFGEISSALQDSNILTKKNMNDLRLETIFGSSLQFFSSESAVSIRGNTVSGLLVIDEAAFCQEVTPNGDNFWYSIVQPITKVKCKKILLISTPNKRQGFFYDFYIRGLNGENGIKVLKRTIYQDSLVSKEYIEDLKRNIPKKYFDTEYLCEFMDESNTFFEGFSKQFILDKYDDTLKCHMGIDLSSTGADNTIVSLINSKNQVRQYQIEGSLDSKYSQIAKIINDLDKRQLLQKVLIEKNGIGSPMINQIKKLVNRSSLIYEWQTTNNSKESILADLAVMIAKGEIFFLKDDFALYQEMANFEVSLTKTKKLKFEGRNMHDDRIMSLAIALRAKQTGYQGVIGNIMRL